MYTLQAPLTLVLIIPQPPLAWPYKQYSTFTVIKRHRTINRLYFQG